MAKMTEDSLKALVDSERRQSIGYGKGKLAELGRKSDIYFLAIPEGDLAPSEIEGRSTVVSTDVRDTILAMLPQLMLKFCGGDSVVEFEPSKPGDEQKAKQCTDYLNYIFFKKNNGHSITWTAFMDAMRKRRGVVKVWWDDRREETREEYRGVSEVELAELVDDPELEITEQSSRPDEEDAKQRKQAIEQLTQQLAQAQQAAQQNPQAAQAAQQMQARLAQLQGMPPAMLFDLTCKRSKDGGHICIENVPPHEFGVSAKTKTDLQESPFVHHSFARTISDLKSMGYKNTDQIGSDEKDEDSWIDPEIYAEQRINDDIADESQKRVMVHECYLRCDFDGDGISELRKVTIAGGQVLDNEIVDIIPFVSFCPNPMPHKFYGLDIADLAMERQKGNTFTERAIRDNLSLEVNGRYFAVEGQVNLDDLLSSRPGGVVRMKAPQMAGRLDQGKGSLAEAMQLLEYGHQKLEDSTGWSRVSQTNDPDLKGVETATKTRQVTNKADMRTDMVARNFAEGFVELFRMMLKLVCQYQDKRQEVRIAGEWVDMDPREWRNLTDVNINVGLGVGSRDQQIGNLMQLQNAQVHGMAIGISNPENLYHSSIEMAKNMGFKNGDKFFTKPDPNKPPPNPMQGEMQKVQMELQAKGQMAQAELQHTAQLKQMEMQQEAQLEQMRAQMQAEVDRNRQASEAEQQRLKLEQEGQLATMEAHFAQERHAREQQQALEIARIQARASIIVAKIGTEAQPSPEDLEGEDSIMGVRTPSPADELRGHIAQSMQLMHAAIEAANRPKVIVRDAKGRAVGVQPG